MHKAELGDDRNRTRAEVWKSAKLTRRFLTGVRGAIPLAQTQIDDAMIESIHRQQPESSRAAVRRRFVTRADRSANILAPVENQCRWLRAIGFAAVDCYFKIYELAVFGGQKPK